MYNVSLLLQKPKKQLSHSVGPESIMTYEKGKFEQRLTHIPTHAQGGPHVKMWAEMRVLISQGISQGMPKIASNHSPQRDPALPSPQSLLTWGLQNWETINFCCVSLPVWGSVTDN